MKSNVTTLVAGVIIGIVAGVARIVGLGIFVGNTVRSPLRASSPAR